MRDRLIELLSGKSIDTQPDVEYVADYLLENGVVLVDTNRVDFVKNRKLIQTALNMPLDELSDLIKAKEEGRIIVPPCKVGDIVYAISESRIEECRCDEICIYGNDNIVMTEHNCDYDCKGCPFSSWGQDYSGEHSCQGEYGVYSFNFKDFGKTVFLTREEAERALKGGAE